MSRGKINTELIVHSKICLYQRLEIVSAEVAEYKWIPVFARIALGKLNNLRTNS